MVSDEITGLHKSPRMQLDHCRTSRHSHLITGRHIPSADTVIAMLQAIARENEVLYATGRELFAARATGCSIEHAMAMRQFSHSCKLFMSRISDLQKIVVGFDHDIAGFKIGSLAELGLRAQTLAILLLLDELRDAMRYGPLSHQELFTGRLCTVEDVVWFLFDALPRVNQQWLLHRAKPRDRAAPFTPKVLEATSSLLYRSSIREAQRAIAELGADPDLAHFLRVGSSYTDVPPIRHACHQLADILNLVLTREPDPALFLAAAVLEPGELHDLTDHGDTTS
jgi:hypothetical protein